ncbi:MAG: hypothetical protein ACLSHL_12195 [Alistipes communis]
MSVEELTSALETYIRESPRNYVDEAMALVPSDVGQRLYDTPLVRVGSADDPEWEEMKRPEAVGHLFRTPKEWLPEAVSVVSYFAPFSDFVVEGNKRDAVDVGNGWLYARVEGQAFLTEVNRFLERWFRERGYRAVAPMRAPGSGMFSRPEPMPKSPTSRSVSRATGRSGTWPTSAGWGRFRFRRGSSPNAG